MKRVSGRLNAKYGVTSQDFYTLYQEGLLDDEGFEQSKEFTRWASAYAMKMERAASSQDPSLATWRKLLLAWKELVERDEDEEERAILKDWLDRRATGAVETVSLDELERELVADGLLPG